MSFLERNESRLKDFVSIFDQFTGNKYKTFIEYITKKLEKVISVEGQKCVSLSLTYKISAI